MLLLAEAGSCSSEIARGGRRGFLPTVPVELSGIITWAKTKVSKQRQQTSRENNVRTDKERNR